MLVLAVTLVAAACGGSDDGSDAPGTTAPETAASSTTSAGSGDDGATTTTTATTVVEDEPTDPPAVGANGSFTVNGEEFAVTLLNRCIPFSDQPGNIDLQALDQTTGALINLNILGGSLEVSVQGGVIEQMFGSLSFASDFLSDGFEVTADRFTGSATASDAFGGGDTVDLTWDVAVPSEIRDCSA